MSANDEQESQQSSVSARSGVNEASLSQPQSRASESARELPTQSRSSLSRAPSTSSVASFSAAATAAAATVPRASHVAFAPNTTGGQSGPPTARSVQSQQSARANVDTSKGYFKPMDAAADGAAAQPTSLAAALAVPVAADETEESTPPAPAGSGSTAAGAAATAASATASRSPAAHVAKISTKTGTKPSPQRKASLSGSPPAGTSSSTPTKRAVSASRNGAAARPSTANASPLRASPSSSALLSSPQHHAAQHPAAQTLSPPAAATWSFEFPRGQASPARKSAGASGVFKSYFSPSHPNASPAYQVYAAASAGAEPPEPASILQSEAPQPVLVQPAPMAEFPLSPFSRAKQLDSQARKASAARRELAHQIGGARGSAGSPVRPGTAELRGSNTNGAHSGHATRALGHSASAAGLSGADAYGGGSGGGGTSFARRMIHAQSAAELLHPASADPLSDDPDASSLFFHGRSARPSDDFAAAQALAEERGQGEGDGQEQEEEEWHVEQQQLVPYGATPSNSYATAGSAAQRRAHQQQLHQQQQRPNTAGVSSTGVAWSSRLTATLSAESAARSPARAAPRPLTSSSSGRRLPAASSLPPELTVGVEAMPAHMQRDHAALAKLIARLEPAGRASLAGASASFSKLSTSAARDSLFAGRRSSPEPSQTQRLENASASDELLRRRSIQKGIENQRQSSAALASRGASGLAGNNLNGRAVADAVRNTNAEYPISDERPRNARPATAAPFLGVAAALAAAGSPAAAELIGAVTAGAGGASPSPSKKLLLRPGTAARPSTSNGTRRSRSGAAASADSEPLILLPGMGTPAAGGAPVLGFGGSIDRFASSVEELRFVGSAQSATGGRGLMGSRSAHKILGGLIPTGPDAAAGGAGVQDPPGGVPSSSKRFSSLALEFEVSLQERLVRIEPRSATAALERLDVARTLFDDIILHSPVFGGLLSKVKAEYEAYARGGGGGDAYIHPPSSTRAEDKTNSASASSSSGSTTSHSMLTAQKVEDTLVLENHRLNAKLHGFQRAYTSLYAKYKSLLHTQKVQEGILAQNALVLADLNSQLQAAVLASMADEERNMDALRRAGFKLENETEEDAREAAARRLRKQQAAILPDIDLGEDEEEGGEGEGGAEGGDAERAHPSSEAGRRRAHARKVARARRTAEALARAQSDPLERGRQLMRQFQRPAGYVAPAVAAAAEGDEEDDAQAEGAPLSPTKLSTFLDAGLAPAPGRATPHSDPHDLAGGDGVPLETDPLDFAAGQGRRELHRERAEKALLEQRLLRMETLLEQARAKELQALMAVEERSTHRYLAEKHAKESAAAAAKATAAPAAAAAPSSSPHHAPAPPARAMLDNISVKGEEHGRSPSVSIPALPLKDLVAELEQRGRAQQQQQQQQQQQHRGGRDGLNGPSGSADASPSYDDENGGGGGEEEDEDPDSTLLEDGSGRGHGGGRAALSEKDRTIAELRFQRQMVDSRLGLMGVITTPPEDSPPASSPHGSPQSTASPVPPLSAAARSASAEADATMQLEVASQLSRKTSRSAYTLTGTVEEDNWFD